MKIEKLILKGFDIYEVTKMVKQYGTIILDENTTSADLEKGNYEVDEHTDIYTDSFKSYEIAFNQEIVVKDLNSTQVKEFFESGEFLDYMN